MTEKERALVTWKNGRSYTNNNLAVCACCRNSHPYYKSSQYGDTFYREIKGIICLLMAKEMPSELDKDDSDFLVNPTDSCTCWVDIKRS